MSAAATFTPCPPEETLVALHEGRLAESIAAELRRHIDLCSTCLTTLAALASCSRGQAATMPSAGGLDTSTLPEQFDGFRLLRTLGRGAMGHVFLAHEVALERSVAIKVLASSRPDSTALARFLIEARAIARLSHPNVVAIYRIGEVAGRPYLAYEHVHGPSLDRVAKPMPWGEVLSIALGLSRGLAAAHQRDVLHRDIKPANVILAPSGQVKLLDFGLAKLAHDAQPERESIAAVIERLAGDRAAELTATGALLGTPSYMAPELWAGQAATARSDIYSLGLLLYEACAGRRPRGDLSLADLARRALLDDLPPVRAACPSLPEGFAQVIDRCVARAPEARFSSAAEVRDELEALDGFLRAFRPARPASQGSTGERHDEVALSFARVSPLADRLVALVYARLFQARPDLRSLFPSDMAGQHTKLASALRLAVENLGAPSVLEPMLEELGRRHAASGALPEHFDALGRALFSALAEMEGDRWSDALRAAWESAYDRVTQAMLRGLARGRRSSTSAQLAPLPPPETRFTGSGDAMLAYQTLGHGPLDLVVLPAWVTHLEAAWACPHHERLVRGLARSARVIAYDQRGAGLSERSRPPSSNEERLGDLLAVMDAAGSRQAVIFGASSAAGLALLFAERFPERTRGLVIAHGSPGGAAAPELGAAFEEQLRVGWGGPLFFDLIAPSASDDEAFRRWWAAYLRTGSSPSVAIALRRIEAALGAGEDPLPIAAPTLVVHRQGDRVSPPAQGRAIARRIAGARYVELPGDDHLVLAGDVEGLLAEVGQFLDDLCALDASGVVPSRRAAHPSLAPPSATAGLGRYVTRAEMDAVDRAIWPALPVSIRHRLPAIATATQLNSVLLRRSFVVSPAFLDALLRRVEHREGEPWLQWKLIAAFYLIEREVGPATLFQTGQQIFATMPWPPEVSTVEDALRGLDPAFRAAHHDEPASRIGGWPIVEDSPGQIVIDSTSLYPCPMEEGTIAGICSRFPGATYSLLPDPPPKRAGGTVTRYRVRYPARP